jgi:hypothetical protein
VSPQAADRSVEITSRVAAAQTLATVVIVEALRAGKSIPLRITGRSMYPFLSPGEVVLLEPCPVQSLEAGDLVAFERGWRVILHRVLAIHPGKVIEKGDNVRQETVVEGRQVLGRAKAVVGQRTVSLMQPRYRAAGRLLARLSALHGRIHWFAAHRCRALRPLARAFTLMLRLTAGVVRPAASSRKRRARFMSRKQALQAFRTIDTGHIGVNIYVDGNKIALNCFRCPGDSEMDRPVYVEPVIEVVSGEELLEVFGHVECTSGIGE